MSKLKSWEYSKDLYRLSRGEIHLLGQAAELLARIRIDCEKRLNKKSCMYCEKPLLDKKLSALFCSVKCNVYWGRKKKT